MEWTPEKEIQAQKFLQKLRSEPLAKEREELGRMMFRHIDSFTEEEMKRLRRLREKGIDTIFYDAPHVLILYSKSPWDSRNAAIAITYGMLSAHSLGLGTCWIGMAHGTLNENPNILTEIAGIKDQVLAVMTLGYPAVKYFRAPPRPLIKTTGLDELE